jgi:stage III sporulation protein AH
MINKQKLWFLTLFSIILVLAVYYIALPEASLSNLIESESTTSSEAEVYVEEDDALATLRVEDDEEVLAEMEELQETLLSGDTTTDEKNNAYEKLQSINLNKGKEDTLETLILNTYNLKSFIKIKDDQINVIISSNDGSYKNANDIIRTIQNEFTEKKYITVKYQ